MRHRGSVSAVGRWLLVWLAVGGCELPPRPGETTTTTTTAVAGSETTLALTAAAPSASPAPIVPTAAALAGAVPVEAARVTDLAAPSRPEMPVVVIVRDVHINENLPSWGERWVMPKYTPEQRRAFGVVAGQILRVEEALLDAGVTIYAGESFSKPADRAYLDELARVHPDLAALLAVPAGMRRAKAEEILARGSNLSAAITLAAVHGDRAIVEGVEPPEDVARTTLYIDAMHRLAEATDQVTDPFSALRARVLAGAAGVAERARYARERTAAMEMFDEWQTFAIRKRSRTMADGAIALARRAGTAAAGLVSGGGHTDTILERLRERGAGYVVVEPLGYPAVAVDHDLWVAGLRARFPADPHSGSPSSAGATSSLPSLDPWVPVLKVYAAEMERAGRLAAARAALPRIQPPPEPLPPGDPVHALLAEAAARLAAVHARVPVAVEAFADPGATLADLGPCVGDPRGVAAMAYDEVHHCVRVARWIASLHTDERSAVLAQQLVHASDARRLAEALGLPREECAIVVGSLPKVVAAALRLHRSDRALRINVAVAEALGVRWPPAASAPGPHGGAPAPADRLRASLGRLAAARHDVSDWLRAVVRASPKSIRPRLP